MKKVKCINTGTIDSVYLLPNELITNQEYIVINETEDCFFIINSFGFKGGYFKKRFIEIEDTKTPSNPTHYHTKIQPIEFIEANNLGFHEGNVIKYITRYKDKNGIEDLEKAKTYIEMLIDKLKRENV